MFWFAEHGRRRQECGGEGERDAGAHGHSMAAAVPRCCPSRLPCLACTLAGASIYWLLSAGLGGVPVGTIAQQHGGAAAELAAELLPLAQRYVLASGQRQGLGSLEQVRGGRGHVVSWVTLRQLPAGELAALCRGSQHAEQSSTPACHFSPPVPAGGSA